MTWESVSRLAELTGTSTRTARRRCELLPTRPGPKNSTLYESRDALPAILIGGSDAEAGPLDLTAERARLAAAQANKTELEVSKLRGRLVDADIVTEYWQRLLSAMRSRFIALPTKLAQVAISAQGLHETKIEAERLVHEALSELSTNGLPELAERTGPAEKEVP